MSYAFQELGFSRAVGRRPDGDKGVTGGHALRRAETYNVSYLYATFPL